MNPRNAYAHLLRLGAPVMTTSEVAAALKLSPSAATMLLTRLANAGLGTRIKRGLWNIGPSHVDRFVLLEALTAPFPSYVSLQTALHMHGLIEQVPSVVYAVSLGETRRIRTTRDTYSIHHISAELFAGFVSRPDGSKIATAEKALFDIVYFSGARTRVFAYLPELELPPTFRQRRLHEWTQRIASPRRRSMVQSRLRALTAGAAA